MVGIIDYGAGNLRSVQKAVEYLGYDAVISKDREEILSCDRVILPGVGNFGDAALKLKKGNLVQTIYDVIEKGTPFLGICLGFQLLFESSEEAQGVCGLGLIPGIVKRIPDTGLKIPQMGWNSLSFKPSPLFENVPSESYVYFVHSYYAHAKNPEDVIATTEYGISLDVAVQKKNLYGVQFHPEKSSKTGLKMLQNFIKEDGR